MNRVLFIDDEPNVIAGLQRQLSRLSLDWEFEGVNSAMEALHLIGQIDYDTIVLDIRMPEMDGLQLLARLQANPKTKHIPVIMLTGCAEKELKRKALDLGAYDFVNKPADPHELAARLQGALRMKSYEDQLREQNITLERQLIQSQKMELVGFLASSVAHDLNNILAVIAGHAQLASLKAHGVKGVKADLDRAQESCDHGARLVQQILRLGRGSPAECALHDLRDIIDESLMLLSVIIPKNIEVVWSKPHRACTVSVDLTQMLQVLMNLITNAVQAMEGSGVLTIGLSQAPTIEDSHLKAENLHAGPYFKVSVADTGSGMDQSTLDHIFHPFFTTKEKGKGTGIGLSVVHRIVKKFGGLVAVRSTVGVETTFYVYLPTAIIADNIDQYEERGESDGRKATSPVCR